MIRPRSTIFRSINQPHLLVALTASKQLHINVHHQWLTLIKRYGNESISKSEAVDKQLRTVQIASMYNSVTLKPKTSSHASMTLYAQ